VQNKLLVIQASGAYDAGAALGEMDPKVGMKTTYGTILTIESGALHCNLGVGSGSAKRTFETYQLHLPLVEATGSWSWPTGDGSIVHHHTGVATTFVGLGSGCAFLPAGGAVFTFGR
jgi:hypothetical protein